MIVSVQKDIENPEAIAKACSQLDIKHIHIPLEGANQEYLGNKQVQESLRTNLQQIFKHMHENEERVLLHCSAGFHRTGISSYTLLRWTGLSSEETMDAIKGMRKETHDNVGQWRVQLAEDFIV